ncbi:MAG: hypothetical protein ACXVB6_17715, partial [Mucilaginibacter sp.]
MMTIKKKKIGIITGAVILLLTFSFLIVSYKKPPKNEMINVLNVLTKRNSNFSNPFNPQAKLAHCDSLLALQPTNQNLDLLSAKASLLLKVGKEQEAVQVYGELVQRLDFMSIDAIMPDIGMAYMRLGERTNCMLNHTGSSCIFPIKDDGVHRIKNGSQKAIEVYKMILRTHPQDLESKWLLNIAFMTLGGYPKDVPREFLIPNLDADTAYKVKPFTDMAAGLGLNINGRAGGVIVDDFNNDGYLDI